MRLVLSVVFLLVVAPASDLLAQPHIHILMYSDDAGHEPNYARSCDAAVSTVNETFHQLVPKSRFTMTTLRSSRGWTDGRHVLNRIRNYRVSPGDTFVYLHASHGGRNRRGHYLSMRSNSIDSDDLRSTIEQKRCKLRLILTNSCNVGFGLAARRDDSEWNVRAQGIAPVMESLFLNHSGTLHMNSAYKGEFTYGSVFFTELCGYLASNPRSRPSWLDMDRHLDHALGKVFDTYVRDTDNQTHFGHTAESWRVVYWKMASKDGAVRGPVPGAEGPAPQRQDRLGLSCRNCDGGVHVVSVTRNSPATRLRYGSQTIYLERDDHVLAVNGIPVRNVNQYRHALRNADRNTTIQIRNSRDGQVYTYGATLNH